MYDQGGTDGTRLMSDKSVRMRRWKQRVCNRLVNNGAQIEFTDRKYPVQTQKIIAFIEYARYYRQGFNYKQLMIIRNFWY